MCKLRYIIKFFIFSAVLALFSATALASDFVTDTLTIRFRLDSIHVDMDYAGNRQSWESFERSFRERYSGVSPYVLRLDIYSGASPEGTFIHNRWLGESRGEAIRRLVRQRLGGSVGNIIVHNEAARWEGLYDAVAASDEPWRDEVLSIIELPASTDGTQWDHREVKLRTLRGGTVWPLLLDKYLSPLRSGATAVLSWLSSRDTIVVRDTVVLEVPLYPRSPDDQANQAETPKRKPVLRLPAWILRTNLPLLGAGTPNLQAEWSLGHRDKWSLNVEGIWSWWTFSYNAYANEIIYGSVELRRWLGRRYRHHTLDGWHIGLGIGGGYGDLEWKSRGYQWEIYSGFVNLGWQRRFGRRKQWAFDAGIALGYAHIPWRRYTGSSLFPEGHEEIHDDHLMWRETGRTNWVGMPHANISIGYVFRQHDASWRRARALERDAERYSFLHFRDSVKAQERFKRDSLETAERQLVREISLLPSAERKVALDSLKTAKRNAALEDKAAKRRAKADAKLLKKDRKIEKQQHRKLEKERKAEYKKEVRARKAWERTPDGKAAKKQAAREEKQQQRQAAIEAKAARKQAKADAAQQRKAGKLKARSDAERRRDLDRLQRSIEKADQKYNNVE